jgi:hypothetical protein
MVQRIFGSAKSMFITITVTPVDNRIILGQMLDGLKVDKLESLSLSWGNVPKYTAVYAAQLSW